MNTPQGAVIAGAQAPVLDQSTLVDMYRLGEEPYEPSRSQIAVQVYLTEKNSAMYNNIVKKSLMPSDIVRVADLSQKGNGSDVIKAKSDRKAIPGRKPAGKATLEDALAAFKEASDLSSLSLHLFA